MAKKVTRTVEKKKEGGVKSKKVTYKTKSGTTATRTKSKGGGTGKRKSTTVTNKAGNTVATSAKAKRQYGTGTPKRKKKAVKSGNTTVTTRKQSSQSGKQGRRTVHKNGREVSRKEKAMVRPVERALASLALNAGAVGGTIVGAPARMVALAAGAGGGMGYGLKKSQQKRKEKNGKVVKNRAKMGRLSMRDVPLPKSKF
jgi:hypothetical protein